MTKPPAAGAENAAAAKRPMSLDELRDVIIDVIMSAPTMSGRELSVRQIAIMLSVGTYTQVSEMTDLLNIPKASVTRNIDRLEVDGFVRRGPHNDKRRVTLVLTPKGRRLIDAMDHNLVRAASERGSARVTA